jgi:hypothetical protein
METEQLLQKTSETFWYDEGVLRYRGAPYQPKDKAAGWVNPDTGYHYVQLNGKQYRSHRLIFLMLKGYLPKLVDHINRDRLDNRIENLREATKSENTFNSARSDSALGVSFDPSRNKWRAYTQEGGRRCSWGRYATKEEALSIVQKRKYNETDTKGN